MLSEKKSGRKNGDDPSCRVVYVTCATVAEAEGIAHAVVSEKLAACVNIVPSLTSVYFWEGSVQRETECLLIIKTVVERLDALETRIKALHSYTVPEFIVLPVVSGSHEYLAWVGQNTEVSV